MNTAARMTRIGIETAFAVGEQAAAWARSGNRVYPFHLGDMNIPTPANIQDAALSAMRAGKTGYAPTAGIPGLRSAIASDVGGRRGLALTSENVSVQPGGKPVIGKFLNTVLEPGDEALYPNPGYPIYESMIEFLGGKAVPYGYIAGPSGFELDFRGLERAVSSKTRVLIYNNQQNPLGTESTTAEMQALAELAVRRDLWVLSDEAYFDIRYSGESHSISSMPGMAGRTVILYTFSKKYAMTGWRLGAAVGPEAVISHINKLNTNDESCTNNFVQWAGLEALTGDQSGSIEILRALRRRRDAAFAGLSRVRGVSCYLPENTFYLFPDVTDLMRAKGFSALAAFQEAALKATGLSFCTRNHFGRPLPDEGRFYTRFAYSGIDVPAIEEGLAKFSSWGA